MSRYKWDNLILFSEQLSSATQLNLPLDKTIQAMSREALDPRWKGVQESVGELVGLGSSLSMAMENYPKYFPGLLRRLVRVGEEGNVLPVVLASLSRYLQAAREIQNKLRKCLIYPFFVWTILLLDMAILFLYAVPNFSEMYRTIGMDLPFLTRLFIQGGSALSLLVTALLFYLAWLLIGFLGTDVEKEREHSAFLERLVSYIPILSALHRHAKAAQICEILGILITGGHNGREAIRIARSAVAAPSLQLALDEVDTAIASGTRYVPNGRNLYVPDTTLWMLAQADKSPELGATLRSLSEYHRRQLDITSNTIREILEPLLLLMVAILGGFAIISVYLPLFNLANVIG